MMSELLEFADREEFRNWLSEHCLSSDGVWLLFGKAGGPKTIKAGEALEEAGGVKNTTRGPTGSTNLGPRGLTETGPPTK